MLMMYDEMIATEMKKTKKLQIFENFTSRSLLQNYLYNYKYSGTYNAQMSSRSMERASVKFTLL